MNTWDGVLLGIVQGLTEYLPVSSSGHLVLGRVVLDISEPDTFFDILVHVATLIVTLIFYRQTVRSMVEDALAASVDARSKGIRVALSEHADARLALLLVAGTVPTGLIGVIFKDALESLFAVPRAAAGMLLVTALLMAASRFAPKGERGIGQLRLRDALVIGFVQGLAIIPGISRSGSTIVTALFLGVERELAARFSFLLSVPAILGALVLKLGDLEGTATVPVPVLASGFIAALVTGFVALIVLLPMVRRGTLHYFSFYLVPVAMAGLLL